MFNVTSARPAPVPKANAGGEGIDVPADYTLANGEATVPMTLRAVGDVALTIKTTSASYVGATYTIQVRNRREDAWVNLIAPVALSANGTVVATVAEGSGAQLRILNTNVDTMEITVYGTAKHDT